MRLYDMELSGNCYKVRLFLSLIGQTAQLQSVNILGGEHRGDAYLQINPRGLLPALEDEGAIVVDSQAILTYLARRYGAESWLPLEPLRQARVASWLSFAAHEVHQGPNMARLHKKFGMPIDVTKVTAASLATLALLDAHLSQHHWLAEGDAPTIADIAVYPYVALAGEGAIDLSPYAHVQQWFGRLRELPGYIGMPGL
jgi:glutathione S-transferase